MLQANKLATRMLCKYLPAAWRDYGGSLSNGGELDCHGSDDELWNRQPEMVCPPGQD